MENFEFDYSIAQAKTLFYMWKGYSEYGNQKLAEEELIRRVENKGIMRRRGPCKIVFVENGRLKFTILANSQQVFEEKSISVDNI